MIKKITLFLLCLLIPASALASGGEYECIINTDCRFLWVAINNADHVSRYGAAIVADGATDINFGWYYDDDDALTDISDANEVDESTNCSSEVPANGMCLEIISASRGIYVIYVDSLLITESGKEFCIDVDDAYPTTKVDDAVLCKYVAVEDRVITTDNIGINLNNITQATGPTTLTNITIPTVTTLTNAPSLTTADKQQLGVIKQITASGTGNTTTVIESSNLSETDNKAYVGNLINCAGATNAANKVVTLKIIKFDPTTDRITLGGILPAALTVGDTCNILMDTLR